MGSPISVGDILMLSNLAWKIGRSFTSGKGSAPSEFAEIEREAVGLCEALKLVADTLQLDESVLRHADDSTKLAVKSILESAQRTLEDLDSFVKSYQVIKKEKISGGFTVERQWSDAVIANFKTLKWTTEGGNIAQLRDMLHMHANTISLVMQALQSRSLARLEKTVMPMAQEVASIHDRVNGDLGQKIDQIYHIIMAVVSGTPSLMPIDMNPGPADEAAGPPAIEPSCPYQASHLLDPSASLPSSRSPVLWPPDHQESQSSPSSSTVLRWEKVDSGDYSLKKPPFEQGSAPTDLIFEHDLHSARSSIDDSASASPCDTAVGSPNTPFSFEAGISRKRPSNGARPDSTTLPILSVQWNGGNDDRTRGSEGYEPATVESPTARFHRRRKQRESTVVDRLPPPAMSPGATETEDRVSATPASTFGTPERLVRIDPPCRPSATSTTRSRGARTSGSSAAASALEFEKALFRNSVIHCDVQCNLVELAQHDPAEMDPRFDTEMVPVCHAARLIVIRKRENRDTHGTNLFTSIWALSDDGEVRCQQKLSEDDETVPYCSSVQAGKISLSSEDGEISLRYHGPRWGDAILLEKKTNWLNYVFDEPRQADLFQSAVFGRKLLGSFRTTKTTVLHEGVRGAFAFEEQFANIEVLRLWEDDGIYTVGANGGVLALMHLASNFGLGWARWWMNSSKQQVRLKDEGGKFVKLKGINLPILKPGIGSGANTMSRKRLSELATDGAGVRRRNTGTGRIERRGSTEQLVTGIRIEFKTDEERKRFVTLVKAIQERPLPLPDL